LLVGHDVGCREPSVGCLSDLLKARVRPRDLSSIDGDGDGDGDGCQGNEGFEGDSSVEVKSGNSSVVGGSWGVGGDRW
jgi:hypothetical protein